MSKRINREAYLKLWEDFVKYSGGNFPVIKRYTKLGCNGYSKKYDVTKDNFQKVDNVWYALKIIQFEEPMPHEDSYYRFWYNQFTKTGKVLVFHPVLKSFQTVVSMEDFTDLDVGGCFIFKKGVTPRKCAINRYGAIVKVDNTEGEEMKVTKESRDDRFVECVKGCADERLELTDLEKSGKWYGVIFKADGQQYGSKEFRNKKHAIKYVKQAEYLGWTVVLYKRFASYTADIPVLKGD
jgi:hypothetical protein